MPLKLIRKADQTVVVSQGVLANTYFTHLRGLIGTKKFENGEGMLFIRSNSIHMWMMSIAIDVVFLKATQPGKEWNILSTHANLKPWKLLPVTNLKANDVLELPQGTIARLGLKAGEVLCTVS